MTTAAGGAAARRERLARLLRQRSAGRTAPLTPAQRRLWFLEQLNPGEAAYHIPTVLRLDARLDEVALEQALNAVVARHEALRSVVVLDAGEPRQRVQPSLTIPLTRLDLTGRPGHALDHVLAERARLPFDLANGPLLRAILVRTGAGVSYLSITVHHLVADGWSLLVITRELSAFYRAAVHGLADPLPPPLQYPDYAAWLQRQLAGGAFDDALAHFRAALDGAPPWLELPTEQPQSAMVDRQGAVHRFELDPALVGGLHRLLRGERATLYIGLLAGFAILLHRVSGQDDVVIGSPVAGRDRINLEDAVGLYANVVARRVRLAAGASFRAVLRRVRESVLAALPFQELPFERLVEALNPPRDAARNPVFQVLFSLQNAPSATRPQARASEPATPAVTTGQAQFELALTVQEVGAGLRCSFEYPVGLLSAQGVARMADQLVRLLGAAVHDPDLAVDRLPLLGDADRAAAVRAGDGGPPVEGESPLAAIAGHAEASPGRTAIVADTGTVTFRELEDRVAAWAARLRRGGVDLGDPVLVSGERTADLVAAFLAVLRVGAMYVPIDPALPAARVALLVDAVRPRAVVSLATTRQRWSDAGLPWLALDDPPAERNRVGLPDVPGAAVAYVIFTSGSTGLPKPVMVSRAAMEHHSRALQRLHPLGPDDTVLLATAIGFDASIFELLGPLAAGASLAVPPGPGSPGPDVLVGAMARHRVSALQVVPSMLRALVAEPGLDRCRHLRQVYCGGEMLTAELRRRFSARSDARLLNMYGPTEATIDATHWPGGPAVPGAAGVPIGLPIPGIRAVVVDRHLEPVPDGVTGELLVGGAGVAYGYLDHPAATAERFRPDPYGPPGSRAYLTGDLVRGRAGGVLEFVGRRDGQVKISGLRVELGEIEAALRRHPAVVDAVAVLAPEPGQARLAAGVVPADPAASRRDLPDALRRHLLDVLPLGLLPATIEVLDTVPVGPAGKVDRAATQALLAGRARPNGDEPPRPGAEQRLARLWRDVLGVPAVSRHDSFFDLGGHSLLATRLASQVRVAFGVELPLRELFANPTVAATAAWLAIQPTGSADVRG